MSDTLKLGTQNRVIRLDENGKSLPTPAQTIYNLSEQIDATSKAFNVLRDAIYEGSRAQDEVTKLFNDDNVDMNNKNLAWTMAENHVKHLQSLAERTNCLANEIANNLALRTAREFWNKRS